MEEEYEMQHFDYTIDQLKQESKMVRGVLSIQ